MNQNALLVIILFILGIGFVSNYFGFSFLPGQEPKPETHTIMMNKDGFDPAELTIRVGDSVAFKNRDVRERWPASGVHPTHQLCPGFDALKALKTGETYSHTFTKPKECPFHDHLNPDTKGKITVAE